MRPNAFQEFGLRFLVLLIVLNNIIKCNEKATISYDDSLFNFDIDSEMSYMDLYTCLNQEDFYGFFINNLSIDSNFNSSFYSGLLSKIIYSCKTEVTGSTRKKLSNLLNYLQNMQMEKFIFPKSEIEFVDI